MSNPIPRLVGRRRLRATSRGFLADQKMTQPDPEPDPEGVVDGESLCPEQTARPSLWGDGGVSQSRELHFMGTVGRANTHVPRNYGPVSAETVTPEEQVERSERTRKANDRRATRRAADHAMEGLCNVYVVGILDEESDLDNAVRDVQCFGHRVSDAHLDVTGTRCRYVGVIVPQGPVLELRMLFSSTVPADVVLDCWAGGDELSVTMIEPDDIEQHVFDMGELTSRSRVGTHRFIRSKGPKPPVEVFHVADIEEAREIVRDLIAPDEPVLTSAQPFGHNPRATFRFNPIPDVGCRTELT